MNYLIIGIVVFLACTIWGRVVGEKGLKLLTNEQKGLLLSQMAGTRKWSVLFLAVIVLGFLLLAYYVKLEPITAMYGYFGAFLIYTVAVSSIGLAQIKKLKFSNEYYRLAGLASILRLVGLVALIVCMAQYLTENASKLQNTF